MKFGKYLAKRQLDLPEYSYYFINYKALKKLIKSLSVPLKPSGGTPDTEIEKALQDNKATFFFQLERELEKVNTFYLQKEAELKVRINILCEKKQAAYKAGALSTKSSVTYISLYEGFQRFRRDLERLEQFIELNGTGFSKVLKKWDKRSKSHTKELYLSRAVEVQPVFHREELANFSDLASSSLIELEAWSDGDNVVFEEQSQQQLLQQQQFQQQQLQLLHQGGNIRDHDDLYREFVKAASSLKNNDEEQIHEIINDFVGKVQRTKDAKERLTRIFLLAISSEASNVALAALYRSGYVDIHAVDEFSGKTCLHRAAATEDRRELIDLALGENIDVKIADVYGKTALHYACLNNHPELIPLFLNHGADLNALDKDNFSPLSLSIVHNFSGCVQDLVNFGAKVNVDSEKDYIPLNLACQYGNYDIVKILLDKKPIIAADAEGLYPIHVVARAGLDKLVPLLKSYDINVNELDKLNQWTALCYAASEGHFKTVRALLDADADATLHDDNGYSALYHAAWEGRAKCTWELARNLPGIVDTSRSKYLTSNEDIAGPNNAIEETLNEMDLSESTELIPDLSLPPPIIPLQRYGHNFLDNKKIILQLLFDPSAKPINFHKEEDSLPAGRLTLSTRNSTDFIPRSIILPISDNDRVITFQVESLETFSIDFEIFSTFGTRIIAKTSVLPYVFNEKNNNYSGGSEHYCRLPIFDIRLKSVGDISFKFQIVRPFSGKPLEITKYDTYWKSTSQVESQQQPHQSVQAMSFVTASSLSGSYSQVSVCLTKDFQPVVSDNWYVSIKGIQIPIGTITLKDLLQLQSTDNDPIERLYTTLSSLIDATQLHAAIKGRAIPLRDLLIQLPVNIKLNICVLYPTSLESTLSNFGLPAFAELNIYVDHVLNILFDHAREVRKMSADPVTGIGTCRSLIFSSANPDVCAVLNWKQPNYPVFFHMTGFDTSGQQYRSAHGLAIDGGEDRRCVSLKDAASFAANNNLLGIICSSELLRLVPSLIPSVRVLGLVLVSDLDVQNEIDHAAQDGVDGIRTSDVLLFKQTIDM